MVYVRHGVKLSKTLVSYWGRGKRNPYNGTPLPSMDLLQPSKELAYVIGVVAGDGYVWRRPRPRKSYHHMFIGLKVKDREFADEFSRCLAIVLNRPPPKLRRTDTRFIVQLKCKVLYELLKKPLDIDKIRKFVEHDDGCKAAFLRGFFDSEGCVPKDGSLSVYNSDLGLLRYVKTLMKSLNIEATGPHLQAKRGKPFIDQKKENPIKHEWTYTSYIFPLSPD